MSYLVLARKYRPRSFEALVGQEHVVQALVNALTRQRLHHAYLFTGTRGVGKTTVSRILAKSLNCTGADGQGGITAAPCGLCAACRDIDSGRFVDYVELDAASNRGVEEITRLLDQAVYKPVLGRFKVYMIDEVHMLSNHAFNAMLKTLEEPPEYLKFVLATTDPQKVPPTVLSRCLQFNLRPMAPQTVQSHLAAVLAEEGIAADGGALRLIARAAHGSMRDALSLTDQAIAYGAGALVESGVRQMLGAVDRSHARRLVEALAARDGAAVVAVVDGLRGLGLSAGGTLEELAALLQQMALAQLVPQAMDVADPETPEVLRLAPLMAADETQLLYSLVLQGRAEIGLAPDEHSGLVMVLLRWLAFAPDQVAPSAAPGPAFGGITSPGVDGLTDGSSAASEIAPVTPTAPATAPAQAARVTAAARAEIGATRAAAAMGAARVASSRNVAMAPEPPPWLDIPPDEELAGERLPGPEHLASSAVSPRAGPPPGTSMPAALSTLPRPLPVDLQPTPLGDRWDGVVRALLERGSVTALARELAWQSQCVTIEGGLWTLRVERESLRAPAQRDRLQAALGEALGEAVVLQVELGATGDTPARRDAAERALRQQQAEQIIHDDPLVQALMHQYNTARIVPGSVKPH